MFRPKLLKWPLHFAVVVCFENANDPYKTSLPGGMTPLDNPHLNKSGQYIEVDVLEFAMNVDPACF